MVQIKSSLAGIPVSRAMITEFRTLSARNTLADAVELILAGSQQDFPIVDVIDDGKHLIGILTRSDLLSALPRLGQDTSVAEVMRREFEVADSHEMLEVAFARLRTCACHTLPVMHDGRLVGLVTMENVGEFLRLQAALVTGKTRGLSSTSRARYG
jgi:CBS domain-containing protein